MGINRLVHLFGISACLAIAGSACAPRQEIRVGLTRDEVVALKGKPVRAEPSTIRPTAEILQYVSGESVQIEQGAVVGVHRDPDGARPDEGSVQYWRHAWKGQEQIETDTDSGGVPSHAESLRELRAPAAGQSVIFDSRSGQVKRIVTFAKPRETLETQ